MYLHLFFFPVCQAALKEQPVSLPLSIPSMYLNLTKDLNIDYWTGLYLLTIFAVFTLGIILCFTWCCCCSETEYEEN